MKKRPILIVLTVVVLAVAAAVAAYAYLQNNDADNDEITIASFEECVEAGFDMTEIHPRECTTDDGQVFTEELPDHSDEETEDNVSTEHASEAGVVVSVDNPLVDAVVTSPLVVSGSVPGTWSFEASFGLELLDENGQQIAEGFTMLDGDWMTEDMVPFEGTIEFNMPSTATGTLVLHRANPSDDPSSDDKVLIPIRFSE